MSTAAPHRLHGEIETPRPLRAKDGDVSITGWCLAENLPSAPAVRLVTDGGILPMTVRTERTDATGQLPGRAVDARCGFVIEGRLPAGVYLARFEAQLPDGSWQFFKALSLAVERAPFVAVIDEPVAHGILRDRVRVGGWALQPDEPLRELVLRYGHREMPCELNRPRRDVPALFPRIAHSSQSGFESREHLVAGHGPARLRGRLASGRTVVASTKVTFSIGIDENHGPELDLTAERVVLPGGRTVSADPPARTSRPLNIIFVLPGSFDSNSALHVAALANELTAAGHACVVAVPHDSATLAHLDRPAFRGLMHSEAEAGVTFADGRGPDLIHAWTTRENVRRLTQKLRARHKAKVIVHLEDNEQEILALTLGRSLAELEKLPEAELDRLVPADLSHPRRGREFVTAADGVTVITGKLREFVPAGRPCHTIVPAADARYFFPRPVPEDFRRVLDITPGTTVLFYHGNVHASNAVEVRELYAAVLRLNREGQPVTLLRTGLDRVDFLGALAGEVAPFVLELGQILHHRHLPPLMALADIFVQPGRPDAFNDYRFPSKLPEFFSLGRPVVLPRSNLGTTLRHGIDAYVLDHADASGITAAARELCGDRGLYDRLALGATAFAAQNFSWRHSAEALARFYSTLTV
jgi:glycosyltransferase involved in cell wall biosynthesis